jgi:hypothetical protein
MHALRQLVVKIRRVCGPAFRSRRGQALEPDQDMGAATAGDAPFSRIWRENRPPPTMTHTSDAGISPANRVISSSGPALSSYSMLI